MNNHHRIDVLAAYSAAAVAAVVFALLVLLALQGRPPGDQADVRASGSIMHYLFTHRQH